MRRRDLIGTAAAFAAGASAGTPGFLACLNQRTMLPPPFRAVCQASAAAGFRHIELWIMRLREQAVTAPEAAAILRDNGLKAGGACSANLKLTAPADEFRKALEEMRPLLEYCAETGAPSFVVYSPGVPKPADDDHRMMGERLAQAAELAAGYRVRLALEFFARSNLLGCLTTTLDTIRAARHPNAGVCLDAFHFFVGISKLEDLAGVKPGEIAHVHFHDVPATKPRERLLDVDRVPPGEGILPLDRLTAGLARAGYRGPLSVELMGPEFQEGDPTKVARRCFQAVDRYARNA